MRKEHFETRGTKLIEKQHLGEDVTYIQPEPNLVFEKRRKLVSLLFKNQDVDEVPEEELQADRMEALHNIIKLGWYQMPLHRARRKAVQNAADIVETPEKCGPRQCLDCFHNPVLPYAARTYTYSTQQKFRQHAQDGHFSQYEPDELRDCPECGAVLEHDMHFKNHAERAHGIPY